MNCTIFERHREKVKLNHLRDHAAFRCPGLDWWCLVAQMFISQMGLSSKVLQQSRHPSLWFLQIPQNERWIRNCYVEFCIISWISEMNFWRLILRMVSDVLPCLYVKYMHPLQNLCKCKHPFTFCVNQATS